MGFLAVQAADTPASLFDRQSRAIDPAVAAYWGDHYDIARLIETNGPEIREALGGKVHVTVDAADAIYLDGSVRKLEAAFGMARVRADFSYVPDATHSMSRVYAQDGDGNGL